MKCYKLPIENNKGCSIYHGLLFNRSRELLEKVNKELFSMGIIDEMWDALEEIEIGSSVSPDDEETAIRKLARWFGLYGTMADPYVGLGGFGTSAERLVDDMEKKSRAIVSKLSDGKVGM